MTVVFTTTGMFILDVFEFPPDKPAVEDQIGGGGTFAALGARMFLKPEQVQMIVDRGSDFQSEWQTALDSYGPCWVYRDDHTRLTTKAKATYNGETRGFEYLTKRKRIFIDDLASSGIVAPEYLHFVCMPARALEIVEEVRKLGWTNTQFVYEPIPFGCLPEELPALRQVLPHVHYFSPNHEEAGWFWKLQVEVETDKAARIEDLAQRFLDEGVPENVIIRSGKLGAYVLQRGQGGTWVKPFYQSADKVVDVTGCGNAFIGGMIAGLHLTQGELVKSCVYGSVAASYTLEQYGLPSLGEDDEWNKSDRPLERLEELSRRLDL